uniref:NTF2 domain-containing protein n=1 Tax=Haptolina ericina TaxID=156174 RepID=A0A7S3FJJ0_9EUKA
MANAQFADIGKAFVTHYYQTFDTNRQELQHLYQEGSLMTFETEQFQGMQGIMTKLMALPFQSVQHQTTTIDSQPSESNGIVVFVTGNMAINGDAANPTKFAQVRGGSPQDP